MRNYALLGHDNEKDFIINYQKNNNEIIINYADETKDILPYTKELEILILEAMKEQVLNSNYFYQVVKYAIKQNENTSKFLAAIGGVGIGGLISSTKLANILINSPIINGATTIIGVGGVIIFVIVHNELSRILSDIKKNKFFIENELFFQNLTECKGFYIDTKKETKEFIENIINSNNKQSAVPSPNINDIDKVSYDTVLEIYDLINKNKEFSKYYEDISSIKKRVRTKNELNQKR